MGEIKLPEFGPLVEEVVVTKWMKRVGDKVEKGDALLEVDIDKATMEIEAAESGVLCEIRIEEGKTTTPGTVVAIVE